MLSKTLLTLSMMLALPWATAADHHADHDTGMAAHLADDSGAAFDVHYLKMMAHHHKSGVAMAKAATEHAQHQEVKDFAAKMAQHQTSEIDQMDKMLKGMGKEVGDGHASFREKAQADLAELSKHHGKEFDKAFLAHMVKHHQDAVAAAKLADGKAASIEVKAMAKKQADQQQAEAEQMRAWHKQWFGADLPKEAAKPADGGKHHH